MYESYDEQSRAEVIALISRQAKRIAELEAENEQLRIHAQWAADRLQSTGLTVDANVLRGILNDTR